MNKNSLENQWKATLQKAEEQPPMELWEKIEHKLDADLSIDKTFQETFKNASEQPEAQVWGSIAAALDREERRKPVFFLWFNRYSAAGLAALLLMVLGFSVFNKSGLFDKTPTAKNSGEIGSSQLRSKNELSGTAKEGYGPESLDFSSNNEASRSESLSSIEKAEVSFLSNTKELELRNRPEPESDFNEMTNTDFEESGISREGTIAALSTLARIEFYEFANSFTLVRPKLPYNTPDRFENDNNQTFLQRSWFGLISGLSPFDPNFKINNFERALASNDVPRNAFEFNNLGDIQEPNPIKRETFAIPLSQPYSTVRSGSGVNLGFDYGKRIGKHFSWQGGVRYMSGTSLVESNVYSYNEHTGKVRTFLESNYIRQDITAFDNTIISSSAFVDNDYKYLMLPMQMAIHVPVSQKLELALSSGVSADFLVNNVLDNIPEGGSKLTAKNSAYKAVNLSGIGSLKMNYMVGENWQVSVGSNVQQTLTSGVEKTQGFTFRPRYIGINTGINYRFN